MLQLNNFFDNVVVLGSGVKREVDEENEAARRECEERAEGSGEGCGFGGGTWALGSCRACASSTTGAMGSTLLTRALTKERGKRRSWT